MKRILFLLICSGWMVSFAQVASKQGARSYYEVPDRHTAFTVSLGVGQLVLQADSIRWVYLTHLVNAGWKLDTVYRMDWWRPYEERIWTNDDAMYYNLDTTKSMYSVYSDGINKGYLSNTGEGFSGSYYSKESKSSNLPFNSDSVAVSLKNPQNSYTAAIMAHGMFGAAMYEDMNGKTSMISLGGIMGKDYSLIGSSGSSDGRLNIGSGDQPMGNIYSGDISSDGNIIIKSLGALTGDADTCVYFDWADHKLKRKSISTSPWEINEGWVRPVTQNQGVNIGWSVYDSLLSVNGGEHIAGGLKVDKTISAAGGNSTNWNTAYGWGNHSGLYWAKSDTASSLLSQPRAASTYLLKSNVQNSTSTSALKVPTWYATKAYADSVKGTITSSQWTTSGSNIYYLGGKIAVGTSNPTSLFQAQSLKSTSKLLFLSNKVATGTDSTVLITSDGHLGIGTTNPTYLQYGLAVMGGIICNTSYLTTSDAGFNSSEMAFNYDGVSVVYNKSTGTSSALSFKTKNIEAIRINPSQLVGIGTTNPLYKLHTVSAANALHGACFDLTSNAANGNEGSTTMYVKYSSTATGSPGYSRGAIYVDAIDTAASNSDREVCGLVGNVRSATNGNKGSFFGLRFFAKHNGSGTLSNCYGVQAQPYFTAGTTTNSYAYYCYPWATAGTVTNWYGYYLGPASLGTATFTNKYALYFSPTDYKSYFAGKVAIGTTDYHSQLNVGSCLRVGSSTTNDTLKWVKSVYISRSLSELGFTPAEGITNLMLCNDLRFDFTDKDYDIIANPQVAAGSDGEQISIVCASSSKTLTLDDGDGLMLSGQFVMGEGDVITLRYISALSAWVEISRSNN